MLHSRTTARAVLVHRSRLLLVTDGDAAAPSYYYAPGGGVEPDDVDQAACVRREVREETGLDVTAHELLTVVEWTPRGGPTQRDHYYRAALDHGDDTVRPGWVDLDHGTVKHTHFADLAGLDHLDIRPRLVIDLARRLDDATP